MISRFVANSGKLLDEWGEARKIEDKNSHQRLLCWLWYEEGAKRLLLTLSHDVH